MPAVHLSQREIDLLLSLLRTADGPVAESARRRLLGESGRKA